MTSNDNQRESRQLLLQEDGSGYSYNQGQFRQSYPNAYGDLAVDSMQQPDSVARLEGSAQARTPTRLQWESNAPTAHSQQANYSSPPHSMGSPFSPQFPRGDFSSSQPLSPWLSSPLTDRSSRPLICPTTPQYSPVEPPSPPSEISTGRGLWNFLRQTQTAMWVLFVFGFAGAAAHHTYFQWLSDKEVGDDQEWIRRYGMVISYFTRSCLVGAVVMAYSQRIWLTFRQKALKLAAIDSLFGLAHNPTHFFNKQIFRLALIDVLIAGLTWILPAAVVLPPTALITVNKEFNSTTHSQLPLLDFKRESIEDFRNPTTYQGHQLSFFNEIKLENFDPYWKTMGIPEKAFDYYIGPSAMNERISSLSILGHQIFRTPENNPEACRSSNCSYTLNFEAPTYDCAEYSEQNWPKDVPSDLNFTKLLPSDDNTYEAIITNVYKADDTTVEHWGPPGEFRGEPELWISFVKNTSIPLKNLPANRPYVKEETTRHLVHCVHVLANFNVTVNVTNNMEHFEINKFNKRPLMGRPNALFEAPLYPTSDEYRLYVAYHSIADVLIGFLDGSVRLSPNGPVVASKIAQTAIIFPEKNFVRPNIVELIPELHDNITLSYLSDPRMAISISEVNTTIYTSKYIVVFGYREQNLIPVYAALIFLALIAVILGQIALTRNGSDSDTSFSRVLVSTRNPELDHLAYGACATGEAADYPKALREADLKFGVTCNVRIVESVGGEEKEVEHCAFGRNTGPIIKGKDYV